MVKNKIIAISGQPVTGKSTTIKALKDKFIQKGYKEENIHTISTGEKFRTYFNAMIEFIKDIDNPDVRKTKEIKAIMKDSAARSAFIKSLIELKDAQIDLTNFSVEQANGLKEVEEIRHAMDKLIDDEVKKQGEEINQEKRPDEIWIFDSRLAFHNIPDAFSIRLTSMPDVAAQRVFNDQMRGNEDKYKTIEEALISRENRKEKEQKRYKKSYGIDLEDDNNYDLIIDTSYSNIEDIADTIITCLDRYTLNEEFTKHWTSPKTLLPLQSIRTTYSGLKDIVNSIKENGYNPESAIEIGECDNYKFIIEGHHRNFASANIGKTLVPYKVIAKDDETIYYGGATVRDRVGGLDLATVYDHEELIGDFFYTQIFPDIYKYIKEQNLQREERWKNKEEIER